MHIRLYRATGDLDGWDSLGPGLELSFEECARKTHQDPFSMISSSENKVFNLLVTTLRGHFVLSSS